MKKHVVDILINEQDIKMRIAELGKQISKDYKYSENELVVVGLLKGSFVFVADLSRAITVGHEVDFITVSSYGKTMNSNRDVKILKDLDEDILCKDILIIEDIVDTGHTLSKIKDFLQLRQPRSIKVCTLLDKPSRREIEVDIEYTGFTITNEFVVGFGIDYAQHYRHLPYIGKITLLTN